MDSVRPKTWIHNKYSARVVIEPKAGDISGLDKFEWFTKDDQNSTFSKQSTEENINTNTRYTKFLGNSEEYEGKAIGQIKIYDKAGNVNNTCQTDEYWIDRKDPSIDVFSIESNDPNYNTVWPNIKVKVNDKYNVKYGIYSDFTPITDDARKKIPKGSEVTINFSELSPNRIDDFNSQTSAGYNGAEYTIGVSAKDEAGNISTKTAKYTVYTDCSEGEDTASSYCGNFGVCSDSCGGTQAGERIKSWSDPHTSKECTKNTPDSSCIQSCGGHQASCSLTSSCTAPCGGGVYLSSCIEVANDNSKYCSEYYNVESATACGGTQIEEEEDWEKGDCSKKCGGGTRTDTLGAWSVSVLDSGIVCPNTNNSDSDGYIENYKTRTSNCNTHDCKNEKPCNKKNYTNCDVVYPCRDGQTNFYSSTKVGDPGTFAKTVSHGTALYVLGETQKMYETYSESFYTGNQYFTGNVGYIYQKCVSSKKDKVCKYSKCPG